MTDPAKAQRFAEVYANLRERFLVRSREQSTRLQELAARMRDEVVSESELKEVEHIAHTLHGSAGTFGYSDLGRISAQVESLVRSVIQANGAGQVIGVDELGAVDRGIVQLCDALADV